MPNRPEQHRPNRPKPRDQRPTAAARGYDARWRKIRQLVLSARPVCEMCKREEARHVDHIRPREQGGSDDESNLQSLCHSCHSRKTVVEDGGFGRKRKERRG